MQLILEVTDEDQNLIDWVMDASFCILPYKHLSQLLYPPSMHFHATQ